MTSLKKNMIYNIAYQLLLIVLPLITAPYISRVLGVDGIGTYSYIYSISYYFGLCGMLGVANHGNRSIALVKNNRTECSTTFWNIYTIQMITTVVALVMYVVYIMFFFNGNHIIAAINILFVISYVLDINWLFFGMEKFKLTVTRNIVIKLFTVISTFIFVKNSGDLWKYTLIMALGMVISQLYLWRYVVKYIDFVKPSWNKMKFHIKPMCILFIPIIAYSIYKVMDKIMLGALTSVTEVGYYENSEKIINIPVGFITAFGTVMMPRIASLISENNKEQINVYSRYSFRYFTMIVVAMTAGLIGVGNILAPVYFGKDFFQCGFLIAGLSITLIFMTWANIIRTQYLIPNKKDKPYVVSMIVGALVNLVLNLIFIPRLKSTGALIGTVSAEFLVFAVQAFYIKSEYPIISYLKSAAPFFPIGIVMCITISYIGHMLVTSIITLIAQVCIGAVIYIFLTIIYFILSKDIIFFNIIKMIKNRLKK